MNGKKHKEKLESQEPSAIAEINYDNFIIIDPTKMPFYCGQCQVVLESSWTWDSHLNGKRHMAQNVNYCTLCKVKILIITQHVNGKKHKKKLENLEKESVEMAHGSYK